VTRGLWSGDNGHVSANPAGDATLEPGARVGNLTIERELGRGGFAVVYLARDSVLDRPVALKVLTIPPGAKVSDEQRRSFLAEARIVGGIHSPHVVTLYHVHEHENSGWMIEMEYVGGGSLGDRLRGGRALPAGQVTEILTSVLRGLGDAHARGVVHRDIKPGNVLLDEDGVAKLADFGTAHVAGDHSLSTHADGLIVGTPWYMAPEMLLGRAPTVASDLWSVGVMAYEMLTGELPYPQSELSTLFFAVQNTAPPPLPSTVPRDLSELVMRCLVKRAEDRTSSADGLLRILQRASAVLNVSDFLPPPRATHRVFGRERELEDALRWLDAVGTGRSCVLHVSGETGMGKGAFVDEVRLFAQPRGIVWLTAAASPDDGPMRGLVQALGRAYGDRIETDESADQLRAVLAGEPSAPLNWGVEHLLRALCLSTGVVVCIEESHHLAKQEAAQLCGLVRLLDDARLGLLFVGRGDGEDLAAALTNARDVRSVSLVGLSTEALYEHLEDYASGARVSADVVKRIAQVTDGNPLFAEQVFEHLVTRGALRVESGGYIEVDGWQDIDLPERFHDAAARRLEDIAESDRELLEIAAVDGREFDGGALAAVSGRPLLQVLRRLQTLCRGRAVIEPSDSGYRFRGGMLQLVLYDQLAPEMRHALHQALAEHLEQRPDAPRPERLARHWESCGNLAAAQPHLLAAARGAWSREELVRFSDLGRRAGMVARGAGELLAENRHLAVALSRTLREQGCAGESDLILDVLSDHAEAEDNDELRVFVAIYGQIVPQFDQDAAEFDADALLTAAERTQDAGARCEAYVVLGKREKRAGNLDEAAAHLERAAADARTRGDKRVLSATLDQLGSVALRRGAAAKARELYAEASALSAGLGRRGNAAASLVNAALAGVQLGELESAAATFESAVRTFELEGIAHHAAQVRAILADTLFALGESERALTLLDQAVPVLQETRHVYGLLPAVFTKGRVLGSMGRIEEAVRLLDRAAELAEHTGDHGTRADVLAERALVAQYAGDAESAGEFARAALELRTSSTQTMGTVATTLSSAVLFGLDWHLIVGLDKHIPTGGTPLEEQSAASVRAFVRAACAFGRGDAATAPLHAGAGALRSATTVSGASQRVCATWLEAEALRREGSPGDARRAALDGSRAAQALGNVWLEMALLSLAESIDTTGEHALRVNTMIGRMSQSLHDSDIRRQLETRWVPKENDT